jgi:hypothetical protein
LEDFSITHCGNNRCGREQPDAFHRRDPLARLAGRVDRAQLLLDLLDLAVQVHQFVIERGEQSPPQQSQLITLIFQDLGNPASYLANVLRQYDSVLRQQPS